MANYRAQIKIDTNTAEKVSKALGQTGVLKECESLIRSAYFKAGDFVIDVKCVGCSEEPAYTEAVLMKRTEDGAYSEVACSEVGDEFEGPWSLEYDGDTYTADVVRDTEPEDGEREFELVVTWEVTAVVKVKAKDDLEAQRKAWELSCDPETMDLTFSEIPTQVDILGD